MKYNCVNALRRIAMTLHRWHELVCGDANGNAIERDESFRCNRCHAPMKGTSAHDGACECGGLIENVPGKPYWTYDSGRNGKRSRYPVPDRETGAIKRLARIMARYPALQSYIQGDPRGASLYILRPGDVPAGADADSYYSRGIAVYK